MNIFFKFKMPDIRLKIVFLAMTQQLTARFQLNFVQGSSFFLQNFDNATDTGIP